MLRPVPTDSEPVLGHFYDVPCMKDNRMGWVAIHGTKHSDPEIAPHVPWPHYHLDWRFIPLKQILKLGYESARDINWDYCIGRVHFEFTTNPFDGARIDNLQFVIATMRRRCSRPMPIMPAVLTKTILRAAGLSNKLVANVENLYAERSVDLSDAVCPHKRYPLAGLPRDADNCVVCPLHGLCINMTTGKVVRRIPVPGGWSCVST